MNTIANSSKYLIKYHLRKSNHGLLFHGRLSTSITQDIKSSNEPTKPVAIPNPKPLIAKTIQEITNLNNNKANETANPIKIESRKLTQHELSNRNKIQHDIKSGFERKNYIVIINSIRSAR